ncbi:inositol monophosphatase family protein [Actinoplanes sp. NPDC051851]|uniref:inositol monophosphatase family protein n=1 Tax=Actinoplanes sp. NPDC051851 TaxID=3154753 RepID=UPI00342570A2
MDPVETDLQIARRAALTGAAEAMRHFAALADLSHELKADGSVVTAADRAVESVIRGVLEAARPDDAILGEEHGETAGRGGRRWILDPIDGTALFVRGDGRWLVLVALEVEGEVTTAVAAVPAVGRVWWASRGEGAWEGVLEEGRIVTPRRIRVSSAPAAGVAGSLLGVVPLDWGRERAVPVIEIADERPWEVQPALHVARGDLDLAVQTGGAIWDFAATSLIVNEAGGCYRGFAGNTRPAPGGSVYAASAGLASEAVALLAK